MGNPTWGDGKRVGDEKWDDGNIDDNDGFSYQRRYCYSNKKEFIHLFLNRI